MGALRLLACLAMLATACAPATPPAAAPLAAPAAAPAPAEPTKKPPLAEPPFARDQLRRQLEALRHPPGYASQVQQLLLRRMPALRRCFEQALKGNPALGGKLRLQFTIGADGAITTASARVGTPDIGLETCLTSTLKRWVFPPPPGGLPITLSLPGD
jgi:hypothetical protein